MFLIKTKYKKLLKIKRTTHPPFPTPSPNIKCAVKNIKYN